MTLLTSFIFVPSVETETEVVDPQNLYIPGATLESTPPNPVSPIGITTGSMGSVNLAKGIPAAARGFTFRVNTTEAVSLIGGNPSAGSKHTLEPSITGMTELNTVMPTTELVKLNE